MGIIIPEIDDIVNFYKPERKIAKETGFVQRESKLGGMRKVKNSNHRVTHRCRRLYHAR